MTRAHDDRVRDLASPRSAGQPPPSGSASQRDPPSDGYLANELDCFLHATDLGYIGAFTDVENIRKNVRRCGLRKLGRIAVAAGLPLMMMCIGTQVRAEEKKLGWSDAGELSYVLTAGNTDTSTLGLKNTVKYTWEKSTFAFNAGAIRTKVTTKTFTFSGPANDPDVDEHETTDVTAEIYYYN